MFLKSHDRDGLLFCLLAKQFWRLYSENFQEGPRLSSHTQNDSVLQNRHHIYFACKTQDLGIERNFTLREQTMLKLAGVLIYWPHFAGREAGVQGSEMTCAKSHG